MTRQPIRPDKVEYKRFNRYEQWEQLMLLARQHNLPCDKDPIAEVYFIGRKRYYNVFDASCALLAAFDKAKLWVPPELKVRPRDLE